MASVDITAGSGTHIATNAVTRDSQTEQMQLVNIGDATSGTSAGVDSNNNLKVKINTSATSTRTNSSVTTTVSTIVASNTSRQCAFIYNSGTVTVFVAMGTGATTTDYSFQLVPNQFFELPITFTGAITAITSSGSATVFVTELT